MDTPLDEMTNEELWQLFPIIVCAHNDAWPGFYLEEERLLRTALNGCIRRISHFGSTSVPGLDAKPTIDILLELTDSADAGQVKQTLCAMGYLFSPQPDNPPPHMMFMKGYTPHGFEGQAIHLHVRYFGDWDELYFRDYLLEHPDTAAAYAHLKHTLAKTFCHDRDGYTNAKSAFIRTQTKRARALYRGRYALNTNP